MSQQTKTVFSSVLNVAVPVSDHDRALRFYGDTLGFEVRREGNTLYVVEVPAG